jgi:hypothetical protein
MHPLALAVGYAWLVFWIYWLVSASTSKESVRGGWRTRLTGVSAGGVFVIAVVMRGGGLAVHSLILATIGAVLFACGIALAVWARLHLGRNWGMPTTQRAEPVYAVNNGDSDNGHTVSVINGTTCNARVTSGCGQAWPTVTTGANPALSR